MGAAIRSRRKSKSLKAKDLAEAAGITQSALSQIENGYVHPSVPTLRRIAAALGTSVFDLADDKIDQKPVVVPATKRKTLGFPGSPVKYQLLSPDLRGRLEVLYFEVEPGEVTIEGGASHAGEECLFIIEGAGQLELDGETYKLGSGDAITFSSDVPHAIRNTSSSTLTAVSAITPPNF